MNGLKKAILLGAVALVASFGHAPAADMPQIRELRGTVPYHGGWYLRGDIGYVMYKDPVVTYGNGAVDFINEKLRNTWLIGGGFGYRHGWFRTDVTVDWRRTRFKGETICFCGPNSQESARIDSWTLMWNVYADLGTWSYVTPYVGAGVGFAYNKVHDIVSVDATPAVMHFASGGRWNLAAAVMAGFDVALYDGVVMDAGYRYIWLGKAESGRDVIANTILYDRLQAHELRVGVRYEY